MQQQKVKPGIGVKKKDRESSGSLARRFVQKVRKSGVLLKAREQKHYRQKPNKRARKKSALVRVERREKYKQLRKWGKVK